MMPSETRNPATRSKSSPGVLMVTAKERPPIRISRGSSAARTSSLNRTGYSVSGSVQVEAVDLSALCHACHAVLRARLVVETARMAESVRWACFQAHHRRGCQGGELTTGNAGSPDWTPRRGNGHDAVGPSQATHHAGPRMGGGERQPLDKRAGNETCTAGARIDVSCRRSRGPTGSGACLQVRPAAVHPMVMRAIMAARGFPGSPTTKRPSGSPASTAGWPGRMAMPSSSSCPPRAVDGGAEMVCPGPAGSASGYGHVRRPSRGTVASAKCREPLGVGIPDPQRAARSARPDREMTVPSCGPKVSLTCPGAGTPDVTTSEPVSTMAITGLRLHLQVVVARHGGQGNVGRVQDCAGGDQHVTGSRLLRPRDECAGPARLAVLCVVSERAGEGCRRHLGGPGRFPCGVSTGRRQVPVRRWQ